MKHEQYERKEQFVNFKTFIQLAPADKLFAESCRQGE